MQVSRHLQRMFDRLEDEAECEQEALRLRVAAETAALKATMTFSRASAVASVEREMELSKAREAEEARLRFEQEAQASFPNAKPLTSPSCLSLSLPEPEPELARQDAEDDRARLLVVIEENRRLGDENRCLAEEASLLRTQREEDNRRLASKMTALRVKREASRRLASDACALRGQAGEMSASAAAAAAAAAAEEVSKAAAAGGSSSSSSSSGGVGSVRPCAVSSSGPGCPADGQRPASPNPEEEGIMVVSGGGGISGSGMDGGSGGGNGGGRVVAISCTGQGVKGAEEGSATDDGLAAAPAEGADHIERAMVAPRPALLPTRRRRLSAAPGNALPPGCSVGDSSSSRGRSRRGEGGGIGHEKEKKGAVGRKTRRDIQRAMIEKEAEQVYLELKANPPPEIRALLAARTQMEKVAAAARSTLKDLKSSELVFGRQQEELRRQQQQQDEQEQSSPPPLDQDPGTDDR
ncbi:unnamed protein product [Pylaiella littoralis]